MPKYHYGGTNYADFPGDGTVFKLATDGTGYDVLHRFNNYFQEGRDGQSPSSLTQGSDGVLYGGTWAGGASGDGALFRLDTTGAGYAMFYYTFGTGDGFRPAGLVQGADGLLYGTTATGGTNYGTLFKVNTAGSGYTDLHTFGIASGDGALPAAGAVQSRDGAFYGTTSGGGGNGYGTVFKLNADGTGYAILHGFSTNADGQYPSAGLLQGFDGSLYGTTTDGGTFGFGTVFTVNTNGTGYSVLHNFGASGEGHHPSSALVQGRDGSLYGTTAGGGLYGNGTVFHLGTNGSSCAVLYNFGANVNDGQGPVALIQGRDGALYGVTEADFEGTVFRLTLPPQITTPPANQSVPLGSNVTLTAEASGAPPLFFQWQVNGVNLQDSSRVTGSQNNVLTIENGASSDTANYRVIVTNAYGAVTSAPAVLDVAALIVLPSSQIEIPGPNNLVGLQALLATNLPIASFEWCAEASTTQPDQVTFTDPTSPITSVFFNYAGTYVLSVTATQGTKTFQTSVTVKVDMNPNGVFQNVTDFLSDTAPDPVTNANTFLTYGGLFGGGTPNTNDGITATNYYQAIDPLGLKTTFTKWKSENGIPTDEIPAFTNGAVVSATYFNSGDLGFGRRMVMGGNDAYPAFAVSNFTNVDDAISGSNLIATVAMEYSPGTNGVTFTKFYVFDGNGNRITSAALDGGGPKFVPGLCIVCHGGVNSTHAVPYPNAGNVGAHFLPFDLGSFNYSCATNASRASQEAVFKRLNQGVLSIEQSYALSDTNRRPAIIELIQGWYGTNSGADLPSPIQNANFVPSGWKDSSANTLGLEGQSYLYLNVVAESCRSCHLTRPTSADFSSFSQFNRIKSYTQNDVFGTVDANFLAATPIVMTNNTAIKMPQARRTFERFWRSLSPRPQAEILRDYLQNNLDFAGFVDAPPFTGMEKIGSDLLLNFTTSPGGSYSLERADDINAGQWIPVGGTVSGTGGTVQIIVPIASSRPMGFYRIVVREP